MDLTLEQLRAAMKLTDAQMKVLLERAQLPDDPKRILSAEEVRSLRMLLLRSYQTKPGSRQAPGREPAPEPAPKQQAPAAPAVRVDPEMERLVLEKKIMIDTCSLMHDKCRLMLSKLLPALQKHGKEVVVPAKVIGELKKHQGDPSDPFRAASAAEGLRLCEMLKQAGCLSVRGTERDNFADNAFFVSISGYRYEHSMLLITQDRKLSQDILRLNDMQSVKGHPVEVRYLNGAGHLCRSSPAR